MASLMCTIVVNLLILDQAHSFNQSISWQIKLSCFFFRYCLLLLHHFLNDNGLFVVSPSNIPGIENLPFELQRNFNLMRDLDQRTEGEAKKRGATVNVISKSQ